MYEVKVEGLMIDPNEKTPVLMLASEALGKIVPIEVNMGEALALLGVLNKTVDTPNPDKPQTYALFSEFIETIGGDVAAVEITDYYGSRFYARIAIDLDDDILELEARPADAVALAVQFQAPIFVSADVVDSMGEEYKNSVIASDESETGQKWTDYLNQLKPEDFGRYKL